MRRKQSHWKRLSSILRIMMKNTVVVIFLAMNFEGFCIWGDGAGMQKDPWDPDHNYLSFHSCGI